MKQYDELVEEESHLFFLSTGGRWQTCSYSFCWQVVNQFDELVEEGHGARDALLKIFTKKIKRSKKKDAGMF